MKSKLVETAGYISIALVLALTLVLSFSAIDFGSGITAHAAASSQNTLNIYPGSTSILAPGFDYDDAEIFYNDTVDGPLYYTVNANVTIDLALLDDPGSLLQFIFYVTTDSAEGYFLYLDNVSLPFSYFDVASDNGWGDAYFVYSFTIADEEIPYVEVNLHHFLEDFDYYDWERVCLYDIRLINSDSGGSGIADNFFSIVGDGISFGFESIAGGITYTVDNLFFEDGNLTDFSVIIFAMTGVSLALAIIKYILRIIFSFGGIKL